MYQILVLCQQLRVHMLSKVQQRFSFIMMFFQKYCANSLLYKLEVDSPISLNIVGKSTRLFCNYPYWRSLVIIQNHTIVYVDGTIAVEKELLVYVDTAILHAVRQTTQI